MLHVVKMIQRRRAGHSDRALLPWALGSALALGTGLFLLALQ